MASGTPRSGVLEPMLFERIALEKVWGGRTLERVPGIALPGTGPIGETWEISDRPGHESRVASGPMRGVGLGSLMRTHAHAMLGRTRPALDGGFPLLVKFLDATECLSVQVHPATGPESKTECWLVLHADPDARVWLGTRRGVDRETLARHANRASIVDDIQEWPVRAGDFLFVPGGTIHAIGAGITLLEVQQSSDVTYRLYDWDRLGLDGKPRALQVEASLRCASVDERACGPVRPAPAEIAPGVRRTDLVLDGPFSVQRFEIEGAWEDDTSERPLVWIVLSGRGGIESGSPVLTRDLKPGDAWLVPACVGRHRVVARAGELSLVKAVPQN